MIKLGLIKKQVQPVLAMTAGAIGAGYVKKLLPIGNETLKSLAPAVLGLVLSTQKGMLGDVGRGMTVGGLKDLASSKGIGATDTFFIGGIDDEVILADNANSVLAPSYDNSTMDF